MKFGYKGLVTFVEMFETVGILEIWVKGQRLTLTSCTHKSSCLL